ncbi:MAG: cupredoxin domain-containing protein [Bacillota bacterium]
MKDGRVWLAISFVLVLSALTAARLVMASYAPPSSVTRPIVPRTWQFHVVLAAAGSDEVTARRWHPGTLVVNAGDTVVLKVTNADPDFAHGFGIAAAFRSRDGGVNVTLQPGESRTFTFTIDRPGIYLFSCTLEGCAEDHADQKGQLVVLPAELGAVGG